jgi:RNA polymerase sigma-70 factor (ECF subfamily)
VTKTITKWIERTQAGDSNAFELIFNQYKNLVFKTAYLLLENTRDAEDALQEIFLKVYRSIGAYQASKGAFSTWIYRITVNHCLNQQRRRLRFSKRKDVFHETDIQAEVSFEENLSNQMSIAKALQKLSNKLRVVLILRYFLDLSYSEIAQVLDVPLGTVKSRLNLALTKIREDLNSEYFKNPTVHEVSE